MLKNRKIEELGPWLKRLIIIVSLLVSIPFLHGMGKQEDALSQADALIAEKRYNEALSILSDYAKNNPRNFDKAQRRIRKILAAKEEYNTTAQDLLSEMEKDQQNDEKILEITNKLYALDPHRIEETHELINQTRYIARFKANEKRLLGIMEQGAALIKQGAYTDALRTYTSGLDIYRDDFFTAGYGAAIENRTRQGINTLTGNIASFTPTQNALLSAVRNLESQTRDGIESQNLATYRNTYNNLGREMDSFTALRDTYANTLRVFREDFVQIQRTDPQIANRNFLMFAIRLIEGRPGMNEDGMLGAFDALWNRAISHARDLTGAKSDQVYEALMSEAASENYSRVESRGELLSAYAFFPIDLAVRWNRYDLRSTKVTIFDQELPESLSDHYLKARSLSDTASFWQTLGRLGSRNAAVQTRDVLALWRSGGDPDELLRTEQGTITTIRQLRLDTQNLINAVDQGTTGYRALGARFSGSGAQVYINGINAAATRLFNAVQERDRAYGSGYYTLANDVMSSRIAQREKELQEGSALMQGTQKGAYLARYPSRAAAIFNRMEALMEADREAMISLINQYDDETPANIASSQLGPLRTQAAALQTRQTNLYNQWQTLAATARTQSEQAENFRREGDRLFGEAQTAYNRAEYETARERLLRSGNAYDLSLNLEDDEETHTKRDTRIQNLDAQIATGLSALVQRRVAEMVEQVQNLYYRNDFDRAEQIITQAQNTWRQTQTDTHPDIEYWQGMIRSGRRSGRTIPATAPLYAEMSQLLSDARKNYEQGQRLLSTNRNEGMRLLTAAKQNVDKIKLVYPMNEEAGLLDLRIEREMDPQEFNARFRQRVEDAINRTQTGNNRIQALNELRNLRAINPQYSNDWAGIIYRAEIASGQRPPPPDAASVARAAELVRTYRPIVASGDQSRMGEARNNLAEAMRLDPNNGEARSLYNAASQTVASTGVVLDSEAERLFQQASQALAQNNGARALLLVNQIYARNPNYRYVNRLVTLEQRARSIL